MFVMLMMVRVFCVMGVIVVVMWLVLVCPLPLPAQLPGFVRNAKRRVSPSLPLSDVVGVVFVVVCVPSVRVCVVGAPVFLVFLCCGTSIVGLAHPPASRPGMFPNLMWRRLMKAVLRVPRLDRLLGHLLRLTRQAIQKRRLLKMLTFMALPLMMTTLPSLMETLSYFQNWSSYRMTSLMGTLCVTILCP
jgi:hypothetical protein